MNTFARELPFETNDQEKAVRLITDRQTGVIIIARTCLGMHGIAEIAYYPREAVAVGHMVSMQGLHVGVDALLQIFSCIQVMTIQQCAFHLVWLGKQTAGIFIDLQYSTASQYVTQHQRTQWRRLYRNLELFFARNDAVVTRTMRIGQ